AGRPRARQHPARACTRGERGRRPESVRSPALQGVVRARGRAETPRRLGLLDGKGVRRPGLNPRILIEYTDGDLRCGHGSSVGATAWEFAFLKSWRMRWA